MTITAMGSSDGATTGVPAMCDVQKPQVLASHQATVAPPPISPQHRVLLYNDEEWEEFIREWATAIEPRYVEIKRFGGAGDRGADVAGGGLAPETAGATLDIVSGWLDDQEQNWQIADILQARRAVSDLHQKLDQVRRQQQDGGSDGGTVIQLKPKG